MTGVEQEKLRTGPRSGSKTGGRRTEVAWSDFTNDSESCNSIDDALDGRGHCREFAFGGLQREDRFLDDLPHRGQIIKACSRKRRRPPETGVAFLLPLLRNPRDGFA